MDIKISNNWLKEYLKTRATPADISKYLSLSGPSVEKVEKKGKDHTYDIEVTTNRVDCMSIIGIAREANAILPQYGFKTNFQTNSKSLTNSNKKDLLKISFDPKLVNRVMAIVLDVKEKAQTPKWMKERLENAGLRSLNAKVDITNYVMLEIGHPTHVFDFDKIEKGEIKFRLSKKGDEITTFDNKNYKLLGDDIVIENQKGEIIDLPGIVGLKNSVVDENSKRIIFFLDNNDAKKIRHTSTRLGIRTNAAILNEKGVDPELAKEAFFLGVELYKNICAAKILSKTYDIYPNPYKPKVIKVSQTTVDKVIGIPIKNTQIREILEKLGFKVSFDAKTEIYKITIPSWRSQDIDIEEDIVEEIARIYGYHNLPSKIMAGDLPKPILNSPFNFEDKVKNILKGYGGVEIYTNSLVPKEFVPENTIFLKNPLGEDTKYLRTSLRPSLIVAAKENNGEKDPFFMFEIANIYKPQKDNLPEENMTLGIIFSNFNYRKAKGIVESLLEELGILKDFYKKDEELIIKNIGKLAILEDNLIYFQADMKSLQENHKEFPKYIPVPKYPAQIEDITLTFPPKTRVGEVIKIFDKAKLIDVYKDSFTFRVWYQNQDKTLDDKEVEKIRNKYIKEIKEKFGGSVKN